VPFRRKKIYDESILYEYAIGALARRMRSVAELKRLLRQRAGGEQAEALVESVVAKLKEQRYLNDAQFAANYSSYRREEKLGRMRVISDLKARGVHPNVIGPTVSAAYAGTNEEGLARQFLRSKRLQKPENAKQAARIFRALARAGFSPRTCIAILKKWNVEDELLSALETENESAP
jgi:regulatory protein